MNILFYSHKCQTCTDLLIILKNEGLIDNFKRICVDDKLDKLPQNMVVPTMILINIIKPLIAHETFEWVNRMKFLRQQSSGQIMGANKQFIQNNVMNNMDNKKKGPIGFDDEMMGGVSDKFAFTKRDDALPHAYFGVNDEDKNVIFTAPNDKRLSKSDQLKLINDLESKRTHQDNNYSKLMQEEQASAVMRTEYDEFAQTAYPTGQNDTQQNKIRQQMMQQQQQLQQQQLQHQMMQQQMIQQQMMQQKNNPTMGGYRR